jgi:hypothetical protein
MRHFFTVVVNVHLLGSANGIEFRRVTDEGTTVTVHPPAPLCPNCRSFAFAANRDRAPFFTRSGLQTPEFPDKFVKVCTFDAVTGQITELQTIDHQNVYKVRFSPRSNYIAPMLRRNSVTDAEDIPLVEISRTGGELVRSFHYARNHEPGFSGRMTNSSLRFHVQMSSRAGAVLFALPPFSLPKFKLFDIIEFEKHKTFRPVMFGDTFVLKSNPCGDAQLRSQLRRTVTKRPG